MSDSIPDSPSHIASFQDHLAHTQGLVDTHGVAIQHNVGDTIEGTFTYTVGLAAHNHPELIVFGLPPEISVEILNGIAFPSLNEREPVQLGLSYEVFEGLPVVLVPANAEASSKFVTVARGLYGDQVEAIQICFPDSHGVWPWDPSSELIMLPVLGDQWDAIRMVSGNVF